MLTNFDQHNLQCGPHPLVFIHYTLAICVDPGGWRIYGLQYLTREDGLCIITPLQWLNFFGLTFTKVQLKSIDLLLNRLIFNDFSTILSKMSPKMQTLGQSGPKTKAFLPLIRSKFVPKSIHQIAQLHFQKYKILQLLRGECPSEIHPPPHPAVCALCKSTVGAEASKNYSPMSQTDLHPCSQYLVGMP